MLDHVGVQVADVEASVAFYLRTFAAIGMREVMRIPVGGTVVVGLSDDTGVPDLWLVPAGADETRELHVAFRALNRPAIDAVHDAAVAGAWRCCTPRASGRSTTRATTPCSCVTSTGTTWRPSTTATEPLGGPCGGVAVCAGGDAR